MHDLMYVSSDDKSEHLHMGKFSVQQFFSPVASGKENYGFVEYFSLMKYDAVCTGIWVPTFRRIILPPDLTWRMIASDDPFWLC